MMRTLAMAMAMAMAVVALAMLGGQAWAADQFDVHCTLTETSSKSTEPPFAFTRDLSFDLVAGEYCFRGEFECKPVRRLVAVTEDELTLTQSDDETMSLMTKIDRRTWRWTNRAVVRLFNLGESKSEGLCALTPYTPIPASAPRE